MTATAIGRCCKLPGRRSYSSRSTGIGRCTSDSWYRSCRRFAADFAPRSRLPGRCNRQSCPRCSLPSNCGFECRTVRKAGCRTARSHKRLRLCRNPRCPTGMNPGRFAPGCRSSHSPGGPFGRQRKLPVRYNCPSLPTSNYRCRFGSGCRTVRRSGCPAGPACRYLALSMIPSHPMCTLRCTSGFGSRSCRTPDCHFAPLRIFPVPGTLAMSPTGTGRCKAVSGRRIFRRSGCPASLAHRLPGPYRGPTRSIRKQRSRTGCERRKVRTARSRLPPVRRPLRRCTVPSLPTGTGRRRCGSWNRSCRTLQCHPSQVRTLPGQCIPQSSTGRRRHIRTFSVHNSRNFLLPLCRLAGTHLRLRTGPIRPIHTVRCRCVPGCRRGRTSGSPPVPVCR